MVTSSCQQSSIKVRSLCKKISIDYRYIYTHLFNHIGYAQSGDTKLSTMGYNFNFHVLYRRDEKKGRGNKTDMSFHKCTCNLSIYMLTVGQLLRLSCFSAARNTMTYTSISIDKSKFSNIFRNNSYQKQGLRVPLGINHGCCPLINSES